MAGRMSNTSTARPAFTLAESLIAAVVLAAGVIGISSTVGVSYKQTRALQTNSSAASLAEQLMEEISAKPWNDPDSGTATAADREGDRTQYDNIYDYFDFNDVSIGLTTLAGDAVVTGGGERYTRTASVQYLSGPNGSPDSNGAFARITVTVTGPHGERAELKRVVARTNVVK